MAVNTWDEDAKLLKKFVKKEKVPYPILLNGSSVADDWGVKYLPTNFLLDADGKVIMELDGLGTEDMSKVGKAIDELIE